MLINSRCIRLIGRLVRKPSNELQQISNRMQEYSNAGIQMGTKANREYKIRAPKKDITGQERDQDSIFFINRNGKQDFVRIVSIDRGGASFKAQLF